jgi:hypothetical protein
MILKVFGVVAYGIWNTSIWKVLRVNYETVYRFNELLVVV